MKRAFSLIELMIVIVIIGVIYTLAVTKLENFGEEKIAPSFSNLKEYLQKYIKDDVKNARLLCLDDCSECNVYVDGVKTEAIKSFFDNSVALYRYDFLQGAVKKEDEVFFNEENVQENVCFSFNVNRAGVADQVVVVYKEKAYDYTTYFEATKVYESLEEFVNSKENLSREVMQ